VKNIKLWGEVHRLCVVKAGLSVKRHLPCSIGISTYVDMVDIVKLSISRVRLESVDFLMMGFFSTLCCTIRKCASCNSICDSITRGEKLVV
jgi:hypothetical protein